MNRDVFVEHYHQTWSDLKEVRKYVFAAIVIFVAANILAMVIPKLGEGVLTIFFKYLKRFQNKGFLELIVAIFLQNATSTFFAIVSGFLFGLVPILGAVLNGIALGATVALYPLHSFKIIPHGLFELPAMFIAWGLGMWCAGGLLHPPMATTVIFRIKKSLNIYVSIIVPLLSIAAIVEVFGIKMLFSA